jgi:hypothetical protein
VLGVQVWHYVEEGLVEMREGALQCCTRRPCLRPASSKALVMSLMRAVSLGSSSWRGGRVGRWHLVCVHTLTNRTPQVKFNETRCPVCAAMCAAAPGLATLASTMLSGSCGGMNCLAVKCWATSRHTSTSHTLSSGMQDTW